MKKDVCYQIIGLAHSLDKEIQALYKHREQCLNTGEMLEADLYTTHLGAHKDDLRRLRVIIKAMEVQSERQ